MNLQKWMLASTIASAAVLVLFYAYNHQTNICVQSSYIEKVTLGKFEVYNCSKNVRVDWDSQLDKEIRNLNEKLNKIEALIKVKSKPNLKIEVLEQKNVYYYSGNHVFLSKNLIESTQTLELHLVKNWLAFYNNKVRENLILEDLLAHFKYFLIFGDLPSGVQPQEFQAHVHWKQVQNSSNHNCVTNWKLTRNWDLCINSSYQFFDTSFDFIYDRLYSKVLDSWIKAYSGLALNQKYEFNNDFKDHLMGFRYVAAASEIKQNSFNFHLKMFSDFWMSEKNIPNSESGKKFLFSFLRDLNKYNFNSIVENSQFDLIYFKQNLNWNTVLENKNIYLLMKKYPHLKIAISNFKEMMILPIEKKIKIDVFSKIRANQLVLETCSQLKISDLIKYGKVTEKLILTYDCDFNQFKKIDQLLVQGAPGFASQNMDVQFAQFHMPSLLQKKDFLNGESEVFQYVQARNVKNSVYEVFGWKELNWDQVTKSYKPKAYVDAIGYFRTKYSYQ